MVEQFDKFIYHKLKTVIMCMFFLMFTCIDKNIFYKSIMLDVSIPVNKNGHFKKIITWVKLIYSSQMAQIIVDRELTFCEI